MQCVKDISDQEKKYRLHHLSVAKDILLELLNNLGNDHLKNGMRSVLGLVQTSLNKPNANELEQRILLIYIRFGA